MKKLVLIAICCVSLKLSAQGNLQFNQVINQSFTGTVNTSMQTLGTITVPSGKVWKVETGTYFYSTAGIRYPANASSDQAYIGNFLIHDGTNSSASRGLFPLWLGPGTYDVITRAVSTYSGVVTLSAIEFNVVP